MTVYNIFFSPTGGTRRVADRLAESMSEACISIDLCDPHWDAQQLSLTQEDLCVIAVPSFGGRVPELAARKMAMLHGSGVGVGHYAPGNQEGCVGYFMQQVAANLCHLHDSPPWVYHVQNFEKLPQRDSTKSYLGLFYQK